MCFKVNRGLAELPSLQWEAKWPLLDFTVLALYLKREEKKPRELKTRAWGKGGPRGNGEVRERLGITCQEIFILGGIYILFTLVFSFTKLNCLYGSLQTSQKNLYIVCEQYNIRFVFVFFKVAKHKFKYTDNNHKQCHLWSFPSESSGIRRHVSLGCRSELKRKNANRACNVVSARRSNSMCVFLFERRAMLGWAEPLGGLSFRFAFSFMD